VRLVEASPHDANTAYVVITVRRENRPYFFRTHDAGKTWTKIVNGIGEEEVAGGLREDPKREGLLFAGTQSNVYVSFDDGDHWRSLQLNLPPSPITDFAVHGDDLIVSTFGRGLWILDDISPLRELNANTISAPVHFFKPQTATRVRWDNNGETPLSPEFPASPNPPDGAILHYALKTATNHEVTLDIVDSKGARVRHFSSNNPVSNNVLGNAPEIWFAPTPVLAKTSGLHRFVWDLRAEDPPTLTYGYFGAKLDYIEYTLPDHAIPGKTPRQQPPGAIVPAGNYETILTIDGKPYRQPLQVLLDPRVHVSREDLDAQWKLAQSISTGMQVSYRAYNEIAALQNAIVLRQTSLKDNAQGKELLEALAKVQKSASEMAEGSELDPGIGPMNRDLSRYLVMVESADMRPAESAHKVSSEACEGLKKKLAAWDSLNAADVVGMNPLLTAIHLAELPVAHSQVRFACD
jgi:hypothetical protein